MAPVNRPAVAAHDRSTPATLESASRERGRAAVSQASDRRALRLGVHAEIDLGEAGRILVHAETPQETVHVKLEADAAHTARALAEHGAALASELRSDVRDARVTVSGPNTSSSFSSSFSSSSSGSSASSGGGGSSSSSRRDPREAVADGRVEPAANPSGRRARFVL
jgi:uncharacterized membrane protein YgcG